MKKLKKNQDVQLLYKINNTIVQRHLFEPYQRILVAVSGGQDSIWMIKIMHHLKIKWQWKVGIVYCDHRWNHSSLLQAKHVACLAQDMQIDYYQPVAIQVIQKETWARNWRYQMLQTIALQYNYTAIITAHNASDRIETLIYNLIRGTGLQGLQALSWKKKLNYIRYIPWKTWGTINSISWVKLQCYKTDQTIVCMKKISSLEIIRPLLDITRTELRELLQFWNISLWPDASNHRLNIHRNRIRHRLLPYIRLHYNPSIDQSLARWTEIIYAENIYLDAMTNVILSKITVQIKKYMFPIYHNGLNIQLLRSLPIVFQRRVLKKFVFNITKRNLNFAYIEHLRLFSLVNSFTKIDTNKKFKPKIFSSSSCIYLPGQGKLVILNQILCYAYESSVYKSS